MFENKISIIIATYNSEKTIEMCLVSILEQNYTNFELVIIDGNSYDATVEILKKFELLFDDKLKWISEKDHGIYDAWNKGLELTSANWVTFIGGDDFFNPNAFNNYNAQIKKNINCNFISSKNKLVNSNLKQIRIIGKPWNNKMKRYCTIAHVASLHHRKLFHNFGKFNINYKIAGDYEFLLRCYKFINPVFTDFISATIREGGIGMRNAKKINREIINAKKSNFTQNYFLIYYNAFLMRIKFNIRQILYKFNIKIS